jgi:hypothetical protein
MWALIPMIMRYVFTPTGLYVRSSWDLSSRSTFRNTGLVLLTNQIVAYISYNGDFLKWSQLVRSYNNGLRPCLSTNR